MLPEILAVLAFGALCGLWIVFQQWISRVDPENRGVQGSCGACSGGECQGACRTAGRLESGEEP